LMETLGLFTEKNTHLVCSSFLERTFDECKELLGRRGFSPLVSAPEPDEEPDED
jgi:hypothetical protein